MRTKDWSQKVKKRNGYKCQACGATKNLQSHHIVAYSKSKKLQNRLYNGTVLCYNCHHLLHSIYGTDCNKEALDRFIKMRKKTKT